MRTNRKSTDHRLHWSALMACAVLVLAAACTKHDNSTSMTLGIPNFANAKGTESLRGKVQSASITNKILISRLMVNVSSPDVPQPVVYIWTRKDSDVNSPDPASVNLVVQSGSARLFQVMAIVGRYAYDSSTGQTSKNGEVFYYGDTIQNVAGSGGNVALDVSSFMNGNTSTNGSVAGRYLTSSSGVGPTGRLDVKYTPPSRPNNPMILTTTEIHGGWFEAVAFENISFSYWFEDGRQLLTSTPAVTNRTSLRLRVPAAFKQDNGSYQATSPLSYYFGFWGPGADPSIYDMCYSNVATSALGGFTTDSAGTTPLSYAPAGPLDSTHGAITAGGTGTTTGYCAAGEGLLFGKTLGFSAANMNDHGTLGFKGPFRMFDTGGGVFKLSTKTWNAGTSKVDLGWAYLPGVDGSDRVSGVEVFWRKNTNNNNNGGHRDYEQDDSTDCDHLIDGTYSPAFTSGGRFPMTTTWLDQQTASLTGISSSDFSSNYIEIVACPYSNTRPGHFKNALNFNDGNSNGNANANMATDVFITDLKMQSTSTLPSGGNCSALFLRAGTSGGGQGYLNSARTLSVTSSSGNEQFSMSPTCASPVTTLAVPSFMGNALIYVKVSINDTSTLTVSDVTGSGTPLASHSLAATFVSATTPTIMSTYAPPSIVAWTCYPIYYQMENAAYMPGSTSASVNLPNTANLGIYLSANCTGSNQAGGGDSYTFPQTSKVYSFMYTGAPTSLVVSPSYFSGVSPSLTTVTTTSPGAAASITFSIPNSFASGSACQAVSVTSVDASWNPTPATATTPITLSTSSSVGAFFSSSTGCSSALNTSTGTTTATIATGTTTSGSTALYYRSFSVDNNITISAQVTSTPSIQGSQSGISAY